MLLSVEDLRNLPQGQMLLNFKCTQTEKALGFLVSVLGIARACGLRSPIDASFVAAISGVVAASGADMKKVLEFSSLVHDAVDMTVAGVTEAELATLRAKGVL